jgi:tRNA(fMet)-specific endonuclease VapC
MDTNIVIEYLKGNKKVLNSLAQAISSGEDVFINGIVYYEIKRGLSPSQSTKFNQLKKAITTIWLNNQKIFNEAASIYANLKKIGQLIGDADILIAATAKAKNLVIVTDDSDFQRINVIQTVNWLI